MSRLTVIIYASAVVKKSLSSFVFYVLEISFRTSEVKMFNVLKDSRK